MYQNCTKTLFHYTKTGDSLQSILRDGFKLSYCKEELWKGMFRGIPMISFCDIPLTRTFKHRNDYGNYTIGLDKQKLMNSEYKDILNPVFYYNGKVIEDALKTYSEKFELLDKEFETKIQNLEENYKENGTYNTRIKDGHEMFQIHNPMDFPFKELINSENERLALTSLLAYLKPYSFKIDDKEKHLNYNENEWRIALYDFYRNKDKEETIKWFLSLDEYERWRGNENEPKPLLNFTINYLAQDVNYIIVPNDTDIKSLVDFILSIEKVGGYNLKEGDKEILLTKITSFERLESDG